MTSTRRSRNLLAIALAVMVGATASCSDKPTRSVEAFCGTYETEMVRLRTKYDTQLAQVDPKKDGFGALLLGMGTLVESQGDLVVLFDRLEPVAPKVIQPEVVAVRDAFQQQAEAARGIGGGFLRSMVASLMSGLQGQGSYRAVEQYIESNCDLSFMETYVPPTRRGA